MAGSLQGSWDKLCRAREHRESLKAEIARIIPYDPRFNALGAYPLLTDCVREGSVYRFYADPGPELDGTKCSLMIGDALFNLRSALDHIVFQLHFRRFKGRIPERSERDSAFPIMDADALANRSKDTEKWREIRALSKRQRRAIEFLQPYHALNDHHVLTRRALSEINILNNIDKHRRLHVVRSAPAFVTTPHALDPAPTKRESFWGPLVGKQEVFRWTFNDPIPDNLADQVNQYREIMVQVTLDEGPFSGPPVVLIDAFANRVELIIRRFETFFR